MRLKIILKTVKFLLFQPVELFVVCIVAIAFLFLPIAMPSATASEIPEITVHRDPSCSCCGGWIENLSNQGFQAETVFSPDVDTFKQESGVPDDLSSCHTAVIDGYIIEGHVPADDIKRLLAEKPDILGLAVPGMPVGTPGMESGDEHESFTVFSFDKQGNTKPFNQYSF